MHSLVTGLKPTSAAKIAETPTDTRQERIAETNLRWIVPANTAKEASSCWQVAFTMSTQLAILLMTSELEEVKSGRQVVTTIIDTCQ